MRIGPKFKIARRLGARIFPKTQTTKFSISGSAVRGRGTGRGRPRSASDYSLQLLEKQKARYTYGLKERQFATYVAKARTSSGLAGKSASPIARLYALLESRLDNVVFRLGLAPSRAFARQMVTHGHISVNGRRLNIPSYQVRVGETVAVREQSRNLGLFKHYSDRIKDYQSPAWLTADPEGKSGQVKATPVHGETEVDINFSSILEFYSRV